MKYILSALLMLAVLALACFGCACYISMEVDMTEACLNQAAEALAAGIEQLFQPEQLAACARQLAGEKARLSWSRFVEKAVVPLL